MYRLKKMLVILLFISLFVGGMAQAESYRLTEDGVQRLSDSALIPASMKNKDWRKYQKWLQSNTPEPMAEPAIITPIVTEQMIDDAGGIPEIKAILKLMIGY